MTQANGKTEYPVIPTYINGAAANGSGTLNLVKAQRLLPGDLVVMACGTRNSVPGTTPGGGGAPWTTLFRTDVGTNEYHALWYKIAGDSEPANFTMTGSASLTIVSVATIRSPRPIIAPPTMIGTNFTKTLLPLLNPGNCLMVGTWHGSFDEGYAHPHGTAVISAAYKDQDCYAVVSWLPTMDGAMSYPYTTSHGGGTTQYCSTRTLCFPLAPRSGATDTRART